MVVIELEFYPAFPHGIISVWLFWVQSVGWLRQRSGCKSRNTLLNFLNLALILSATVWFCVSVLESSSINHGFVHGGALAVVVRIWIWLPIPCWGHIRLQIHTLSIFRSNAWVKRALYIEITAIIIFATMNGLLHCLGDLSFWHIAANYRKGGSYKSFLSLLSITHFVICNSSRGASEIDVFRGYFKKRLKQTKYTPPKTPSIFLSSSLISYNYDCSKFIRSPCTSNWTKWGSKWRV